MTIAFEMRSQQELRPLQNVGFFIWMIPSMSSSSKPISALAISSLSRGNRKIQLLASRVWSGPQLEQLVAYKGQVFGTHVFL